MHSVGLAPHTKAPLETNGNQLGYRSPSRKTISVWAHWMPSRTASTLVSIILLGPGIGRTRDETLVPSSPTDTSQPSELPTSVSSASWQMRPRFSNRKSCPPGPVSSSRRRAVCCSALGRRIESSALGRCARSHSRCSHASMYLASLYNRKQSSKRSATSVESCDASASRWRAADRLALVARSTSSCAALRARRQEARQAQSRTSSRMRQTALNQ
mmetsp:Transcript_9430/g.31327  ORF Transcript_9430/g.31327 Transcript_9430/m.31327 type:complete len:215 (+) Transcript_9430:1076-1720(+)